TRSKRDWSSDVCSSDLVHGRYDKQSNLLHFAVPGSNPQNDRESMLRHCRKPECNKRKPHYSDSTLHIGMKFHTRKRIRRRDYLFHLPGITMHPDRSRSTLNPDVCPASLLNIWLFQSFCIKSLCSPLIMSSYSIPVCSYR